ncbi:hypothetical protein GCM10028784_01680 [Myceligenerans cantabricum]
MVGGGRPQAVRGGRRTEDEWEDMEQDDPGPSYTWLHYVILVVVAFVLGLLIWKLVLEGDSTDTLEEAARTVTALLPGAGRA